MEKLLFTGGTGFLGKNIRPLLDQKYEVTTIGITSQDMLAADLAKGVPQLPCHYDVVLHACGKAHSIPKNSAEEKLFYNVNYEGTKNLCKALEQVGVPKSFVFISTLSVYGLTESQENVDENTPLNGTSPYAKSKIMAEQYLEEWADKNNVILGILRPSLMAGLNPPGNLGAMIDGIKRGRYLNIAQGKARKSLLMVDDIAHVLPKVADKGGVYNLCGDDNLSYGELSSIISKQLGKKKPASIPLWFAKLLAAIGDNIGFLPINSYRLQKLITTYTYSNEKAKKILNWQPLSVKDSFKIS